MNEWCILVRPTNLVNVAEFPEEDEQFLVKLDTFTWAR